MSNTPTQHDPSTAVVDERLRRRWLAPDVVADHPSLFDQPDVNGRLNDPQTVINNTTGRASCQTS